MAEFAKRHEFAFPYLHDESQDIARAYGAVCTPDFFGFDRDLKLKYRGRLDEGRTTPPPPGARRELVEAMRAIAATGVAQVSKSRRSDVRSSGGRCQSNGGSSTRRAHALFQMTIYAARARHSANAAERLCL